MAEITYRDGTPTNVVTFEELHELHEIVELGPNWNDIEAIVITLNMSSREPRPEAQIDQEGEPS